MHVLRSTAAIILGQFFILSTASCADPGIELQFRLPKEPAKKTRLEIRIEKDAGTPPVKVAPNVYAIDFSEAGVAVIDSPDVLKRWRRVYLVTPSKKLAPYEDFSNLDSGWKTGRVVEKLPGGGRRSTSTTEGSIYWMDIEILDAEIADEEKGRKGRRKGPPI